MDLIKLEKELKKRIRYKYSWNGRKQNNYLDALTNFIYNIFDFDELINKVDERFSEIKNMNISFEEFKNYALNRWYNFWSAEGIEKMICAYPNVLPNEDKKNKYIDFFINGINFDQKSSVFPKRYNKSIDRAQENPKELICWLYENQSKGKRQHFENRLFIIFFAYNGEHWKLKSEIMLIKENIDNYMREFTENKLIRLKFNNKEIYSDIIFVIR